MAKKIKILSIDGGGIRGIIPGTILHYIETEIQKRPGQETTKLADHFDLIAGTSMEEFLPASILYQMKKASLSILQKPLSTSIYKTERRSSAEVFSKS